MLKFIENFLKKIEQQNNKSFGKGKLDCCDLNKKNNTEKKEEVIDATKGKELKK